ncbi:serine/threonine-protein kinase [Streptomyces alboniger]|uniref:Serine/threonine protein kinase n=1 Tax=Streptomyces alboniger TaxID=132473 RepID=A0A5J6HH48_STRAD|nr:serine/threonine-protein kinase [Streptomyces alboniger]QEV16385.1 serine/threonine protein kinase [Streptomyces alboniger]
MRALAPGDPAYIGRYRLLGRLGEGGMGRVYLGRSEGGRTVALKVIQDELARVPEFRQRFAREIAAARRVGGQWTAAVLDADTDAASPWVATQYILGPSLYEVVAEDYGPLPEHSVRTLANRLALALEAVHGAGLVHRDLKPANVLVTVDGPRVIDFGIARALDVLDTLVGDGARTRTGMLIGSPGFMSPEQARGRELGPASDVFCLGSVLAYAATGRQPFGVTGTGGMHAQLFRIAEDEPDLDGVPESLLPLVRDCMRKDPARRPAPREIAERTSGLRAGPWLPGEVLEQVGRHAAQLLDFDAPGEPPSPSGAPSPRKAEITTAKPSVDSAPAAPSPLPAPPLAPPTMPAWAPTPTGTRKPRRRLRAAWTGAIVLAVLAAGGGLLATKPWEGDSGGGGQEGGGTGKAGAAVPKALHGKWEGKFPGQGTKSEKYAMVEFGADKSDGDAMVSVMGTELLCVTRADVESAERDEDSGKRTVTLGTGEIETGKPQADFGLCRDRPGGSLSHDPADTDRLVWTVGGQEIQLTRQENTSTAGYGLTTWYADSGEQRKGTLESVTLQTETLHDSTVKIVDGRGSEPSCFYEAQLFTAMDGRLLTTPAETETTGAAPAPDCPDGLAPIWLDTVDDQTLEYGSLDGTMSGTLRNSP